MMQPLSAQAPAMTAPTLTTEIFSDYQSFVDLKPVWDRLVEQAAIDHPFLTHEWVRTWWECFGAGKRLHVVMVKQGREPIALAPLMVSEGRMYGVRVRFLEFIYNAHTPRFDFIVTRDHDQVCRTIWQTLRDQR